MSARNASHFTGLRTWSALAYAPAELKSYPRKSRDYFFSSSFFGSVGGLAGVAGGDVLSDFVVSELGAGVLGAAEGAGAVAGGGGVTAGLGASLAFSGLFPHAATSAAAISTNK